MIRTGVSEAASVLETTLRGTVCVVNLTYHKRVWVRYTASKWTSHVDWPATYTPEGSKAAEDVDHFDFSLAVPESALTLKMAVCFETQDGRRFWDNNLGRNYTFRRVPVVSQTPPTCTSWLHWL